jgi:hypothetical protein
LAPGKLAAEGTKWASRPNGSRFVAAQQPKPRHVHSNERNFVQGKRPLLPEGERRPEGLQEEHAMILGLSTSTYTLVHVVISLVGIASGLVVLFGMIESRKLPGWTALFLATTVLTSVTGFFFPSDHILPSHIVAIISLLVLALAILALYVYRLAGSWRWIYVTGAVVALYLNVFVGVVQSFQKVSFLQPLAPTQSEPPFLVTQVVVLVAFIVLGIVAARKFHPGSRAMA